MTRGGPKVKKGLSSNRHRNRTVSVAKASFNLRPVLTIAGKWTTTASSPRAEHVDQNLVPGPSGESFFGALAMSVPPAVEPADFTYET